jgi:hypothetical protein
MISNVVNETETSRVGTEIDAKTSNFSGSSIESPCHEYGTYKFILAVLFGYI